MPVTYHYEPSRVAVFTFTDPVTFEEWRAAIDAAMADPHYGPEVRLLSDRRAASAPTTEFTRQIAAMARVRPTLLAQHPVAIVVASADAAAYGMGRMQELLIDGVPHTMRTFYSYTEAVAWLNNQPSGRQDR